MSFLFPGNKRNLSQKTLMFQHFFLFYAWAYASSCAYVCFSPKCEPKLLCLSMCVCVWGGGGALILIWPDTDILAMVLWLSAGIGCFVFFLPHALTSPYKPVVTNTTDIYRRVEECMVNSNSSTGKACFSGYESNRFYLFIFCLAQLLMGAGTTPLYSLAPAYIDENVHPKASPIYLGIFFAGAVAGSGLGFVVGGPILNNVYVDIKQVKMRSFFLTWEGRGGGRRIWLDISICTPYNLSAQSKIKKYLILPS